MRACDAWSDLGGCVLPRGHNVGQADVPDAHLFPNDFPEHSTVLFWWRRLQEIQRPRVSWCVFTRKWIVNENGDRHACGSGSYKSDEAFRHWVDAMAQARAVFDERLRRRVQAVLQSKERLNRR